jgi:hypothetical protein
MGALQPFLQSLDWLRHYSSIGGGESIFSIVLLTFPERLIYSTSISLFVFGASGLFLHARRKRADQPTPLLSLLLLTGCVQLLGVLIERKIEFPYQYTRALWAFTPFIAIGLIAFIQWLVKLQKLGGALRMGLGILCVLLAAMLSPLTRLMTQTIPWVMTALSGKNAAAEVERRIPDYFAEEQHRVADYLTTRMSDNDQCFFWGNDVAIYFFADKLPQTLCLTATPFRSTGTPPEWKTKLLQQLSSNVPKYIIAEFGDAKPYITGSPLDSYHALLAWEGLGTFLTTRYTSDTTIGHFHLFHSD